MSAVALFDTFASMLDCKNSIDRMRQLILSQAMMAGLSQQIPDEISEELPTVSNSEIAYPLPSNWSWVRLGDVAELITSGSRDWAQYLAEQGSIFLTMGNLSRGHYRLRLDKIRYVKPPKSSEGTRTKTQPHDILISITGEVGNLGLIPEGFSEAYINQHSCLLRLKSRYRNRFIAEYLRSPHAKAQFDEPQRGIKNSFRLSDVENIIIPFPPLAEQKRIVAKVDELMALCDRLEVQQQEQETRHADLARASLARFAAAPTPANLDFLFHHVYTISTEDLRKAVLTLAMRGKLVHQDPCEEVEKRFLNVPKKAKEKEPKWAGAIKEQETPFDLPPSWSWIRLGEISRLKHGYAFSSNFFTNAAAPFVLTTPGNFYEKGGFRDRDKKQKYYSGPIDPEFIFKPGDLIMPMTEQAAGLLGSPAFIPNDGRVYVHNQRLGKISFTDEVLPEFAYWFFNSEFFRSELARTCTGMKVRHTSPDRILRVPFPVAPLPEQRRIVAKVDQLMALVDQLETQLGESRATATRLMDAIVAELTGRTTAARPVAAAMSTKGAATPVAAGTSGYCAAPDPSGPGARGLRDDNRHAAKSPVAKRADQATPNKARDQLAALLRERGSLSNSEAQTATGLDPATIRTHLQALVASYRARTEGQRRGMRYLAV